MKTWYKKVIAQFAYKTKFHTLREAHDLHVAYAVSAAEGNISHAAIALDVDRRSLQRKIQRIKKRA